MNTQKNKEYASRQYSFFLKQFSKCSIIWIPWISTNHNDIPSNAVKVYLFGGCAMHLHIKNRISNDLDAELITIKQLKNIKKFIRSVDFEDEDGLPCILDFDSNFNPTLAPIDPDYQERAKLLYTTKSQYISLYLVSAVDIAVSKLGRLASVDREDINLLYKSGMFTKEEFWEIAHEAKKYYAVRPEGLQLNINDIYESL